MNMGIVNMGIQQRSEELYEVRALGCIRPGRGKDRADVHLGLTGCVNCFKVAGDWSLEGDDKGTTGA